MPGMNIFLLCTSKLAIMKPYDMMQFVSQIKQKLQVMRFDWMHFQTCFMIFNWAAGIMPEADDAVERIRKWLRERFEDCDLKVLYWEIILALYVTRGEQNQVIGTIRYYAGSGADLANACWLGIGSASASITVAI